MLTPNRPSTRIFWLLFAVVLVGALSLAPAVQAQLDRGAVLLDLQVGAEVREYNDYRLKFSVFGLGVSYLPTHWLAVGTGGKLYKQDPAISGSAALLLNLSPGEQRAIPFVRSCLGTTGEEGAGRVWSGVLGVLYCVSPSMAISVSASYAKNFGYVTRHHRYTSLGAFAGLSVRIRDGRRP